MINDEEGLLRSIQAYVKANLNGRISAINLEKADFRIQSIPEDERHYVYAGELLDLPNDLFVQFAIDSDIEVKSNKNDLASVVNIMVEVAFDNPKAPNTYFKSLRYMRALYECLANYEPSADEVDGFEITKATPMIVKLQGRELVVSGVSVTAAIG